MAVCALRVMQLEKRLLPLFAACRLATSASLGAYSHHQQPDNDYLLLHAEPAWHALEALTVGVNRATRVLQTSLGGACRSLLGCSSNKCVQRCVCRSKAISR